MSGRPAVNDSWQGVQKTVVAYNKCVEDSTLAMQQGESTEGFRKCRSEKQQADESVAKLAATVGALGR